MLCRLNLALSLLALGDYLEAAGEIEPWIEGLVSRGRAGLLAFARVILFAALLDPLALPTVRDSLRDSRLIDPDVAWALELAGDRAAEARLPDFARAAWELSLNQFSALKRLEDVARVQKNLSTDR